MAAPVIRPNATRSSSRNPALPTMPSVAVAVLVHHRSGGSVPLGERPRHVDAMMVVRQEHLRDPQPVDLAFHGRAHRDLGIGPVGRAVGEARREVDEDSASDCGDDAGREQPCPPRARPQHAGNAPDGNEKRREECIVDASRADDRGKRAESKPASDPRTLAGAPRRGHDREQHADRDGKIGREQDVAPSNQMVWQQCEQDGACDRPGRREPEPAQDYARRACRQEETADEEEVRDHHPVAAEQRKDPDQQEIEAIAERVVKEVGSERRAHPPRMNGIPARVDDRLHDQSVRQAVAVIGHRCMEVEERGTDKDEQHERQHGERDHHVAQVARQWNVRIALQHIARHVAARRAVQRIRRRSVNCRD